MHLFWTLEEKKRQEMSVLQPLLFNLTKKVANWKNGYSLLRKEGRKEGKSSKVKTSGCSPFLSRRKRVLETLKKMRGGGEKVCISSTVKLKKMAAMHPWKREGGNVYISSTLRKIGSYATLSRGMRKAGRNFPLENMREVAAQTNWENNEDKYLNT